ncbi:two-component response regulator (GGDEF domain family protein) [Desulforapulum autotrophicum HRM2]|uniref:diguanylate cyclase n=1 Tax=Desulforapulum autotrophicum (strain ATCC 43914 / DSM 3382 / VKM B-1955 / HRM2) TaxID=177437 RepID=C0QBJ5_DESAH|nr:two-component response regulator (GGDEF domain family protein) [Desulforapulum autotrophicum HRM2]
MIIDIDYFKLYNDSYGHIQGDDCLTKVAQKIAKSLRKTDFVARYGGEEFVVVLPLEDMPGAVIAANKIVTNVANMKIPHKNSKASSVVTISLGLAKIEDTCRSMTELLNNADAALYKAKDEGRNRCIVYPSTDIISK